jgi:Ser/Thr protein kinase RdoA (MazF antagonist)
MDEKLAERILLKYGVSYSQILPSESGYRNQVFPVHLKDGRMITLILYKSDADILTRIRNANKVADYLAAQGFPARQTYDSKIILLRTSRFLKYGALYGYLPGHTIPWEAYTKDHIKQLGKSISDMHALLEGFSDKDLLQDISVEFGQIIDRMEEYFTNRSVANALATKLNLKVSASIYRLHRVILNVAAQLEAKQALHMDFVRGNILFDDNKPDGQLKVSITGVIDFEKTACGSVLFDIARTLAFLLVDCKYKPEDKIRKYFLRSGYNKRGAKQFHDIELVINETNVSLLEALVDIFLMYDFYKFLRHNPYESLGQNEHFVRTKAILLRRNCIDLSK